MVAEDDRFNSNESPERRRRELSEAEARAAREERAARRKVKRSEKDLKRIKQAEKRAKQVTGEAVGRGAQAATMAGTVPLRAAGTAASPFTFGTTGVAANVGATAAEQGAYQVGKRGARTGVGAVTLPVKQYKKHQLRGRKKDQADAEQARGLLRAAREEEEAGGLNSRILGVGLDVIKSAALLPIHIAFSYLLLLAFLVFLVVIVPLIMVIGFFVSPDIWIQWVTSAVSN